MNALTKTLAAVTIKVKHEYYEYQNQLLASSLDIWNMPSAYKVSGQ